MQQRTRQPALQLPTGSESCLFHPNSSTSSNGSIKPEAEMAPCQQPLNILSHHFPVGLGEVPSLLQRRWGLAQSGPWSWDFPLRLKRGCKYPGVTNSGVQHRGGASSFLRAGDACSASRLSWRRNIPSQHSPGEPRRSRTGREGTAGDRGDRSRAPCIQPGQG